MLGYPCAASHSRYDANANSGLSPSHKSASLQPARDILAGMRAEVAAVQTQLTPQIAEIQQLARLVPEFDHAPGDTQATGPRAAS